MNFYKVLVNIIILSILVIDIYSNPIKSFIGVMKSFFKKAARPRPGRGEFEIETRFDGEYPLATDNMTIEAMREIWEAYYLCLREMEGEIGIHRSITPRGLALFSGHSAKLDCRTCLSPADLDAEEDENNNSTTDNNKQGAAAKWLYSSWALKKPEPVVVDERILQNHLTGALHIYGFREEDTGNYLCVRAGHISAAYFLELITDKEPFSKVWPETAPRGKQAANPQKVLNKFELSTSWSEWSTCSSCGEVAKKFRPGYCLVRLIGNEMDNDQIADEDESVESNKNITYIEKLEDKEMKQMEREDIHHLNTTMMREKEKILSRWKREEESEEVKVIPSDVSITSQKDQEAVETLEKILNLFKYGLPCRSRLLPDIVKKWPPLEQRPHEIMASFCKIRCPGVVLFEVKDENGVVIERANNSAGVYSALQGIPPIPPPVERKTQFEDTLDELIEINCPGSVASEIPVVWQIRGHEAIPVVIAKESKRRIIIDPSGMIRIKKPRVADSGLYSCWQREKLVGVVRLSVNERVNLSFNHHIMLMGINLIIGTFLLVFFRAFKSRHALSIL